MQKQEAYKNILSDIIKEHMVLFDPSVALAIVQPLSAISLSNDGTVYEIKGDPQKAFNEVKEAYITFGGDISKNTIASIIAAYPEFSI